MALPLRRLATRVAEIFCIAEKGELWQRQEQKAAHDQEKAAGARGI
jgi:hypothetical protein